jgi:GNAT superfamily N-acetyltransferase
MTSNDLEDHMPQTRSRIRVLHCRDWRLVRRLRLAALVADPGSFLADPAVEKSWPEAVWVAETASLTWVAAMAGDIGVGLARSRRAADGTHVESLWVAPDHRRKGVATRLVQELCRIERRRGATYLFVWVLDGNDEARTLYERLGFTSTARRQSVSGGMKEERFALPLRRPSLMRFVPRWHRWR